MNELATTSLLLVTTAASLYAVFQRRNALAAMKVSTNEAQNTLALALQQLTARCEKAERVAETQAISLGDLSRLLAEARPDAGEKDFLRHLVVGLQDQLQKNAVAASVEASKANARVLAIIDSKAEGLVTGQALRGAGAATVLEDLRPSPPEAEGIEPIRFPTDRARRPGEAKIERPDSFAVAGTQYQEPEPAF